MKNLLMAAIASACSTFAVAQKTQQLPDKFLYRYPPAVVNKVYEANIRVNLSQAEIEQLAVQYNKEDSLLFDIVQKGKSVDEIDKLYANQMRELKSILGENRYRKLYSGVIIQPCNEDSAIATYYKNRLEGLQAIKPLEKTSEKKLEKLFYQGIAKYPNEGWATNFNQAMKSSINDTIYYVQLYKDDIEQAATSNTKQYIAGLQKQGKITKAGRNVLYPLAYEKNRQLALLDIMFPRFTKAKDSLITIVSGQYDSLIAVTQNRNGASMPTSQLTTTLKFSKELDLTSVQIDSILAVAAVIKNSKAALNAKDASARYDAKPYESVRLAAILTEDQFLKAVALNNKTKAEQDAIQDWKELENSGLATNYEKENTMKQLRSFHLARSGAYYRYSYDREKQKANTRLIDDKMPAALKALKASHKYNNPTNTPQGNFQW